MILKATRTDLEALVRDDLKMVVSIQRNEKSKWLVVESEHVVDETTRRKSSTPCAFIGGLSPDQLSALTEGMDGNQLWIVIVNDNRNRGKGTVAIVDGSREAAQAVDDLLRDQATRECVARRIDCIMSIVPSALW